MDKTLAHYSFLPWVRQGLGNQIIEQDTLGGNLPSNPAIERPDVSISFKLKAEKGEVSSSSTISKIIKIQGPGDILGINQKTIIRVHPKKGVDNFETNNLCYIEFYEEDLPWRFTPAKPNSNRLRPWLALVVLKEEEFARSTGGTTPTSFISIKNKQTLSKVFGNEKDICALAHVHVLEDLKEEGSSKSDAQALQDKLAANPDLALSRVICPRKLAYEEGGDNTYHAFLIPAFETGRQAGMGEDRSETPAQKASWRKSEFNSGSHPLNYPYYYNWTFEVGKNGDFETLAELLDARELPENVGKREMDLSDMGYGIDPDANNTISYVEGAMRHEDYVTAGWPLNNTELKDELKKILNISADLQEKVPQVQDDTYFYTPSIKEDPIISPPTYGQWHAGVYKLSNKLDWVHDINMHPTHRAAAGLGTRVVQQHQEQFMEMAWEQIGQINEANQKIIESEMAKRVSGAIMKRKIGRLGELDLLGVTGAAFSVLKLDDGQTAKRTLLSSRVPTAIKSGSFIKVANNFTPTALMSSDGKDGATKVLNSNLVFGFNEDELVQDQNDPNKKVANPNKISAAPLRIEPSIVIDAEHAAAAIQTIVDFPPKSFMQMLAEGILNVQSNGSFDTTDVINNVKSEMDAEQVERATAILNGKISSELSTDPEDETTVIVFVDEDVFADKISPNFDQGLYDGVKFVKSMAAPPPEVMLFNHNLVIENRRLFKDSFSNFFLTVGQVQPKVEKFVRIEAIDLKLPEFRLGILQRLNPFSTYLRKLSTFFLAEQANLSKPIMAYPRFPIPMYDYLKDISPDYIIPNISEIEPNTITLMEPNKKFIEAFIAGMNHEFSRELLWREFPTDMRGSYFRHFWEYDNNPSMEKGLTESMEVYTQRVLEYQNNAADVKELHQWKDGSNLSRLGENHTGGPKLVLLIKGDIFKKYPGTLVYAQRAEYDGTINGVDETLPRKLAEYKPDDTEFVRWPIITGKLEPDVNFFGFDLDKIEANGNRDDNGNPGWYFVLRERPGQISFGLDDLDDDDLDTFPVIENWDQVTWENLTNNANTQPNFLKILGKNISLAPNGTGPTDASWGRNAADMAYILYQPPYLFARHASTMLNE